MKQKILVFIVVLLWLGLSTVTGYGLYKLFKSMTDFITVKAIIGCYFFPLLVYGVVGVGLLLNKRR